MPISGTALRLEEAEGEGFEPPGPRGPPVFKTGAFDQALPPLRGGDYHASTSTSPPLYEFRPRHELGLYRPSAASNRDASIQLWSNLERRSALGVRRQSPAALDCSLVFSGPTTDKTDKILIRSRGNACISSGFRSTDPVCSNTSLMTTTKRSSLPVCFPHRHGKLRDWPLPSDTR